MSATARNVLIVLLIAAAVYAIPGGGQTADIVAEVIAIAFAVSIWLALVFVYRNFRTTIYGLGDRHRGLLYGALATLLFAGAAAARFFDTGAGTLVWFAMVCAAVYALVMVWRHWRAYD